MRGWFLTSNGKDMELNGARPDYLIWPKAGDMMEGHDEQLLKAIEVLKDDIEIWQEKRAKIKPHYAHD